MKSESGLSFEIGGRYRNRLGWYEVLNIDEKKLYVRYESDKKEDTLSIDLQQRVLSNIAQEEDDVTPFNQDDKNIVYFQTLGYLTKAGFIEAIIPLKTKTAFDNNFYRIKGRYPRQGDEGYYVHNDPNVDKWGTEMRITFKKPISITVDRLEFGPNIKIVKSPNDDELRINNNTLCWKLLSIGFEIGRMHNAKYIEANIPATYRADFTYGTSIC